MSKATLYRQVGRPGIVLCHYRVPQRRFGYVLPSGPHVWLLSFGMLGHAFGIGWTFD